MGNIILVGSNKDPASMNIWDNLQEILDFETTEKKFMNKPIYFCRELGVHSIIIDSDLITADFLEELPPEFSRILFLSKHASKKGVPSLLVHFPGNWTKDNSMGGKPRTLSVADPILHKALVMELSKMSSDGIVPRKYTIGIEVTHHGPTINRACTFIEIGSSPEEWKDKNAGRIIAEVIIKALENMEKYSGMDAWVGVGGPHYAPKFFSALVSKPILLGHIIPKYVIDEVNKEVLVMALERSLVRIKGVIIDWKGLKSQQRQKIISILETLGVSYQRI